MAIGKKKVTLHLNHFRLYYFWKSSILSKKVCWVTNVALNRWDQKLVAIFDQVFIKRETTRTDQEPVRTHQEPIRNQIEFRDSG